MSEVLTKIIVNCETGEEQVLPLTAEEIAKREADAIEYARIESERKAVADAAALAKSNALAKLISLGLTEEEAKAIAGN